MNNVDTVTAAKPLNTQAILAEVVRIIVATVQPEAVILFGSWARGDARPGSDLDMIVIEDLSAGTGRTRDGELKRLRRALWDVPVAIDLLVHTPEEFQHWRDSVVHPLGASAREGKLLHGAV